MTNKKNTNRLNTNKQFMVGNGLLAFAVIFIVVIFVYMSLRQQQANQADNRNYQEQYTVTLTKGFVGDSIAVYINDSLLLNKYIQKEPITLSTHRFAEQSALMFVEYPSENLTSFNLNEDGGIYYFEKREGEIKEVERE